MTTPHHLLPEHPYATYSAYLSAVGSSVIESARAQPVDALLETIVRSGLRGRGGAGFSTGRKWATLRAHPCETRYVVVNAAEGEPGTFKDRFLLRRNPYAVLEGMLVAAQVLGAKAAFIAIKRSFTVEIDRLRRALAELAAAGATGRLPVEIILGPEEYLFGEEKALLNVIQEGEPLPRVPDEPPYEVGLFSTPASPNPALVSNVETFAHVSTIVRHGAESFRRLGTADTSGTLLVTLSGDVARPGVHEVEAGISLRTVIQELGGGALPGRKFRVALAGVSAAPIPAERFDVPLEFGSLAHLGSGLGSAGFVLIDDATSLPRVAQAVARFLYVESCNQCSACKAGLRIASRALDRAFVEGGSPDDPERAVFGATSAPQGNRCYLPVQGSLVIPALVRRFASDFSPEAARARSESRPWLLPKIVDFDEAAGRFVYDERQPLKQPNWTYGTPEHETRSSQPLAPPPHGPIAVRIAPDLTRSLDALAQASRIDLDQQVERALREWLEQRKARH